MRSAIALGALLLASAARSDAWEKAKADYDAGRFDAAAAAFARACEQDPRDPASRRNLALALHRAGRAGRAVLEMERAAELDPRDARTRRDLAFLLRRVGEDPAPPGIPAAAHAALTFLSERELSGAALLALWAACLLGAGALLARSPAARRSLAAAAAAALAAALSASAWRAARRAVEPPGRAVAVAALELRSGPGERFTAGLSIPEGRRLRALARDGAWVEVAVRKDGVRGWARSGSVEEIDR